MEIIKDGTGSGYCAKVDENNNIHAYSVICNGISYASSKGNANLVYCRLNSSVIEAWEGLLYFKNMEPGVELIISSLTLSTRLAGWGKVELYFSPTERTNGNLITPLNLNRTFSNVLLNIEAYHSRTSQLSLTVDNANEFGCFQFNQYDKSEVIDFNDSLVLGYGDSFGAICKGSSISDEYRGILRYYKK